MTKAIDWINDQGGSLNFELGDSTALFAHVEKIHPITDEIKDFSEKYLPEVTLDLQAVRLLSGDDIIEVSDSIDEYGFLLSLGFIVIADHDTGVVVMNANDGTVHVIDLDALDLSQVEYDEDTEEYFWADEPIEDAGDDFEMVFDQAGAHFRSFEKFDTVLEGVLKGEIDAAELGVEF